MLVGLPNYNKIEYWRGVSRLTIIKTIPV